MPLPLATDKRLFFLWNESKEAHPEHSSDINYDATYRLLPHFLKFV